MAQTLRVDQSRIFKDLVEYTGLHPQLVAKRCEYSPYELAVLWHKKKSVTGYYQSTDLYIFDLTKYQIILEIKGKIKKMIEQIKNHVLTRENLIELVNLTNQELDSNMKSYSADLDSISRSENDTNQRLGRLYDAIETGKVDLDDLVVRIRELRQRQEQLQSRRIEIDNQMSDRKVELLDLETMTEYVTEMQEVLREGTLAERRAFIRSFVKEIRVKGNQAVLNYSMPIPPDKMAIDGEVVPRIVHRGGR